MKIESGFLPSLLRLKIATVNDFIDTYSDSMIDEAISRGADVLTFPDRPWMGETIKSQLSDPIDIALLSFSSYDAWWRSLISNSRNAVRHAPKKGATAECVERPFGQGNASEVLGIFRESPFRDGRFFPGYFTWNLPSVQQTFTTDSSNVSVLTRLHGKVVGIARAVFKDRTGVMRQFISGVEAKKQCRGINNMMLAKLIELLAERGVRYLVYAKLNVLPSLDEFKLHNGFRPVRVNYNYVLLSAKAKRIAGLGLHRRPDLLLSKHARLVPLLASLQSRLPVSLIVRFHLFA